MTCMYNTTIRMKKVCEPDDKVPEYVSLPELPQKMKEVQHKTTEQDFDVYNDVHP